MVASCKLPLGRPKRSLLFLLILSRRGCVRRWREWFFAKHETLDSDSLPSLERQSDLFLRGCSRRSGDRRSEFGGRLFHDFLQLTRRPVTTISRRASAATHLGYSSCSAA